MDDIKNLAFWLIGGIALLWLAWIFIYGLKRASLAFLFRLLWLLPLVLAAYPKIKTVSLPSSVSLKPVNILIDDSVSMKENGWYKQSRSIARETSDLCGNYGCSVKTTLLSELSSKVEAGYTPLSSNLQNWIYGTGGEPWILLSDGGDELPSEPWSMRLQGVGGPKQDPRGLIIGFEDEKQQNIWVETNNAAMFSFENKPTVLHVRVGRSIAEGALPVQIHILAGDNHLATTTARFRDGEAQLDIEVPVASLARGQHLLTIKSIPIAEERSVWDNTVHANLEVMPNTVGLLHLLGSPSWDGRFLRRYLKSEPKYDLISFFILRDPVDLQLTNERELSLIPFPVERLFNQELSNFRSIIIQNFSLYQFLEPSYQRNLVEFVRNGGGLLFIGGSRALHLSDYRASPLTSILPFKVEGDDADPNEISLFQRLRKQMDENGPYYDAKSKFRITVAEPTDEQRALANVFDEWKKIAPQLSAQDNLTGLHRTDNVTFKDGEYTPLLNAQLENGKEIPLVVASYPDKGRALWVFSDTLWKMALNPVEGSSRDVYRQFMSAAITWLLRQELRKPLVLSNLTLKSQDGQTHFELLISGPAARFLGKGDWQIDVCGMQLAASDLLIEQRSRDLFQASGKAGLNLASGQQCRLSIRGNHPAFGSVEASTAAFLPQIYSDRDVIASSVRIQRLARLSEARFSRHSERDGLLRSWLETVTNRSGVVGDKETRSLRDFFWVLDEWWFYLALLGIPLEVLVRRWPYLVSGKSKIANSQ